MAVCLSPALSPCLTPFAPPHRRAPRRGLRHARGTLPRVPPVLAARALEKRYGRVEALSGVDLEVGEGQLVGLLGPNGAGKSTLVKIACGLVRASAGRVEICGTEAGSRGARARLPGGALPLPVADERRGAARAAPAASAQPAATTSAPSCSGSSVPHARDARRRDVEGHAAAARHRAGADRLAAPAPARRADKRTDPAGRRVASAACSRSYGAAGRRCCSTRTSCRRSSWSATTW